MAPDFWTPVLAWLIKWPRIIIDLVFIVAYTVGPIIFIIQTLT